MQTFNIILYPHEDGNLCHHPGYYPAVITFGRWPFQGDCGCALNSEQTYIRKNHPEKNHFLN